MSFISESLFATYYTSRGKGSPVILIHGIAASSNDWVHLVPALTDAGYQTYALDLLGHGDSTKPVEPDHYHFHNIYSQLTKWINSLDLSQPPILIGHSLGGFLSLYYANDHPEIVQYIL